MKHPRLLAVVGIAFGVIVTGALLFRDTRILAVAAWAGGIVLVWGAVWLKAIRQWHAYRDRRAQGDVRSDGTLFVAAVASAGTVAAALFATGSEPTDPLRYVASVCGALALGLFFGAGLVKLTEAPPDPPDDVTGHQLAGRR